MDHPDLTVKSSIGLKGFNWTGNVVDLNLCWIGTRATFESFIIMIRYHQGMGPESSSVHLTLKHQLLFAADDNFKFCCFFKNNK